MSNMKLSDFDYHLPDSLIATHPANPRDHSRLLVLDKKSGKIEHKHFYDIVDYLNKGDVLVVNNSKVIPARLFAKKETGGKVEIFLHKKIGTDTWECMLGGRVKESLVLDFGKKFKAEILKNNEDGTWDLKFNKKGNDLMDTFGKLGEIPLPPYIIKQSTKNKEQRTRSQDKKDYQTVYASDSKKGSVAAPTAGLHFTSALLKKIKEKGVKIIEITLYVGMGTFAPVKTDDIKKHKMHAEWVEINQETINQIKKTVSYPRAASLASQFTSFPAGTGNLDSIHKNWIPNQVGDDTFSESGHDRGGRIIAVGTTSCRALEACFSKLPKTGGFKDWVNIFIYPGYKFKAVDAMITNFHLPKSTLLMLVSALASKKNIDKAYKEAVKEKYRFYSYGDVMFIK